MKNRYFIKNPIYLIFATLVISLVLFFLLYGIIKLEEKIEKKMIEMSTVDVLSITNNSVSSIKNILENKNYINEIQSNNQIHGEIEKILELLITSNIKYAYLLYKDEKGIFRFLVDGADKNEKAFINQKFDIQSSKWLEIYKIKEPLTLEHKYLHELSISYLFPILNNKNEVELILAIDFSVGKIEEINEIISLMKIVIISIIITIIIFLLILIVQSIRFMAIKKTAYTDKLTNVYNRNYLHELVDFINLDDYILATIDIDHFKAVNDNFGHDVGDIVLKEVARIISFSIRKLEDIVIRYGGEEFVVFAKIKRDDSLSALNVIERILKNIEEYKFFYTEKNFIKVTVSIGVNLVPKKSKTFSDAFKLADIALYNAKNKGRNNIQIYDEIVNNEDTNIMMSINDISDAIESDNIICHYQKVIDNNTNKANHYEALLRIVDKKGNIRLPDKILPIIEGTFILKNITKRVLEISYKKLLENENINISINITYKDLINKSIIKILTDYSLEKNISNRLSIEIIQSEKLHKSEMCKNTLSMLRDLGYKIIIDSFGYGYSNFLFFSEIKVDCIKIDGSIILNILKDKVSLSLLKVIINFAKENDIKVIAKHVNSKEIYNELRTLNIDSFQGYYISHPDEFIK